MGIIFFIALFHVLGHVDHFKRIKKSVNRVGNTAAEAKLRNGATGAELVPDVAVTELGKKSVADCGLGNCISVWALVPN